MTHVKSVTLVIFCYVNSDTGSLGVWTSCRFFPSSFILIPWLYQTCSVNSVSAAVHSVFIGSVQPQCCCAFRSILLWHYVPLTLFGRENKLTWSLSLSCIHIKREREHRRLHSLKLKHCVLGGGQMTNVTCKVDWEFAVWLACNSN